MRGQRVIFSHDRNDWETPQSVFGPLNDKYKFTLDPCASPSNAKCEKFYTIEDDGLAQDWTGEIVFINPPYSQVDKWVEKAYIESTINNVTCVLLIPARTDTKWFHNFIYRLPNVEIEFVKGRIKFEIDGEPVRDAKGHTQVAPFPSMIVVFKSN